MTSDPMAYTLLHACMLIMLLNLTDSKLAMSHHVLIMLNLTHTKRASNIGESNNITSQVQHKHLIV
jgi:hypothetical protein